MNEEPEMMTCDWCGKRFPADARACVEAGIDACLFPEEGEEWKVEEPAQLPLGPFDSPERERMKAELGLDDTQLDTLLTTGKIDDLGAIVCLECQDNALDNA